MLSGVAIGGYAPDEQRAFWINLYHALTVRVILSHYPVSGIREIDISPGLFARGPWDRKLIPVEGVELTLNDIEHRILRPIWRDPRVHYALNCASLGCPDLRRRPIPAPASRPPWRRRRAITSTTRAASASPAATWSSPASTAGSRRISAATTPESSTTSGVMRRRTCARGWRTSNGSTTMPTTGR